MKVSKYDKETECLNCTLPFCNRRLWDCLLNPRQRPEGSRKEKQKTYYAKYLANNDRRQYWRERYANQNKTLS